MVDPELLAQALALPEGERRQLAETLRAAIADEGIDEATRKALEEAERDEIENPRDEAPWEEVRARLRAEGLWHIE